MTPVDACGNEGQSALTGIGCSPWGARPSARPARGAATSVSRHDPRLSWRTCRCCSSSP